MTERRNRAAERIAARREPEVVDLNEAIFLIVGFFLLGFIVACAI